MPLFLDYSTHKMISSLNNEVESSLQIKRSRNRITIHIAIIYVIYAHQLVLIKANPTNYLDEASQLMVI